MQPNKRGSIESFFLSLNKKSRNDEQQTESNLINSPPLSLSESENHPAASLSADIQITSDISLTPSPSRTVSAPEDDISASFNDPPAQPKLPTYPVNHQKRSFQSSWYNNRPWLEYSLKNNACYCFYCRHFSANKLYAGDAFVNSGFNNWKKSLENGCGLIKHASCQSHVIATKNYESFKQRQETNSNVLNKLESARVIQIRKNRDRLVKICTTLHLLGRQMIGFRGHNENELSSNQGNFLEILRWAATTDPVVKSIFDDSTSNASYLSHDIQNELINLMSNEIREEISSMVNNCNYALMADECRDISGTQQLSIVIRFVPDLSNRTFDRSNVVKEFFLGFVPLQEFDAETLANKIVEFLNNLKIPLQSCICLCFDGASVMSGCHAGVQVLLRRYMPKGIYIHCSAHRVNLVINDTCKVVHYMWDYFSIISNIHSFFTESGVANTFFKQAQQELGLVQSSTLKLWADTRWDSRWQAIDAIINNYSAVIKALDGISEEGTGSRSTNAGGILMHVKKPIFIVTSFILHKLFGLIKILSDHLKSPSLDYVRGEHLITSIIQQIRDLRNEESFNKIYDKIKEFCNATGVDLAQKYRLPRKTTVPARFQDCFINSTLGQREILSTSTDFMNQIYFPLIDCMLVELNDRFSSKTLSLMKSISTVYPESDNFLNMDDVDEFSRHIDVDTSVLKNEFSVIKSMVKSKTLNDVIEFLNEIVPLSAAFPQTLKMIKSAITMPVSQVTCERSFSKMKIIKNYLRNSMSDRRLSDLAVLAIERSFDINYEHVIEKFANNHKNSRILLR